jgi:hypothetical protein
MMSELHFASSSQWKTKHTRWNHHIDSKFQYGVNTTELKQHLATVTGVYTCFCVCVCVYRLYIYIKYTHIYMYMCQNTQGKIRQTLECRWETPLGCSSHKD